MGGQTDGGKGIKWMDESIDGWVNRNIGDRLMARYIHTYIYGWRYT